MKQEKLMLILITGITCIAINASVAAAAIYYMAPAGSDSNNGSINSPWRSLKKALTVLQAGDSLYARGGTYSVTVTTDNFFVNWSAPGTALAPITLSAYPGETPVFDGNKSPGCTWPTCGGAFVVMNSPNAAYVVIDGLTFQNMGDQWGDGVIIIEQGSNHITIQNCHFLNNGDNAQDHDFYISRGTGGYITIRNNVFDGAAGATIHGYSGDSAILPHVYIYNNLFMNAVYWGVLIGDGANDWQVHNNTFCNNGENINDGQLEASFSTEHGVTAVVSAHVWNNIFYATHNGKGMALGSRDGPHVTEDHNLFYSAQGGSAISWSGHVLGTGSITGDPQFLTAGSNFHLKNTSPAIDKALATNAPSSDFDGITRPQGTGFDIGAFEYQASTGIIQTMPSRNITVLQSRLSQLFGLSEGTVIRSVRVYDLAGRCVLSMKADISDAILGRLNNFPQYSCILKIIDSRDKIHTQLYTGRFKN
ncbi:MAG: choice-of-anchor Q domain-containing protein [Chitinivibrionales bacterium]|nr:choice-of-anchor Q domain-containing protein [Chitinivibrionales bacterium]